jgi:hypothetical protein
MIGSSFWTCVYQMMAQNSEGHLNEQPFEVPISDAPRCNKYFNTLVEMIDARFINTKDSFRFLFVSNPFSLLFSAFVDKIVGTYPTYWNTFKTADPCGATLTFVQFLRNIVQIYKSKHTLDCHVAQFETC